MEQKYIVAFEIGSSCIKGAVATTEAGGPSGRVNILAVETEQLVDKVRYGCVENPGDVAACVTNICHRLQNTPGISPRAIKEVYVGISGRSLSSTPHEVVRDFHTEIEISHRIVDELMAQAARHTIADKEIVAVEPGIFTLDTQSSLDPVGMFGHVLSANVSLVACKPKIKNNIKRVFNDRCALNIAGFIVTPLAMGAQLLTFEERRLGVMLVDFGAETTTVSMYRDGAMTYLATIPMGSRNITRDITTLNCLEERAEEIKKAVGNAMPPVTDSNPLVTDGLDNSEINNIVAARADEIISNIFEQINYSGLKPEQLPAGIVVTGGGARLRGFNDLLAKQTHMKVRQATVGAGVNIVGNGFNATDSLDVISILCDAAIMNPVECTMMPPQVVKAQEELQAAGSDTQGENTATDIADNRPRISRNFVNDRDDDENIMADDFDPDEDNGKTGQNKDKDRKRGEKPDPDRTDGSSRNFWTRLSQQLGHMLKDDDEFDG